MAISTWLSGTFSHSQARRGKRRNPASRLKKARSTLEPLEARALLASYTTASVSALIADINAANTNGGTNTITLTAATTAPYVLTAVNNTSNGATGLPVIAANDNLTIGGGGDTIERSIVSGTPDFRLFDVAVEASLTLQSLTLEQGSVAESGGLTWDLEGGAIYNEGALTLSGVTLQNNTAILAGGGVYSYEGSVTLEGGSIVSDNVLTGSADPDIATAGGGLYAEYSTVTVTNATLGNNSVFGPFAFGGGIGVYDSTVTVTNAALDNNLVTGNGYGGGLYVGSGSIPFFPIRQGVGASSTLTATNTTLNMNTVDATGQYPGVDRGGGGGLYMIFSAATLSNDTVESNTASKEHTTAAYGGGIYIAGACTVTLDPFTVANTINNTDESGLNGPTANIDGTYTLS